MATFNVTITDTGVTVTTAAPQRLIARAQPTATGLTITDTVARRASRNIADTGLTVTDSLGRAYRRTISDTGLFITDVLVRSNAHLSRSLTDTGLTITDTLGKTALADTGLTITDSLAAQRVVPRNITDTGLALSDSLLRISRRPITDRGLTFTDDLVVRKNGHNTSVTITSVGVAITESISKSALLFRAIPGSFAIPDQGAAISDGIRVTTVPPQPPPTNPAADFTFSAVGLLVTFTDTSTPGSAGPITSWHWDFGDGGTSTLQNPTHTYAGIGTYSVTLIVNGTGGHTASTRRPVAPFTPSGAGLNIDAVVF